MRKWLQRTVGTAGLACGIALAAAGMANAAPVAHSADMGVGPVGPLSSVTDTDPGAELPGDRDGGDAGSDATGGLLPGADDLTGTAHGLPGGKTVTSATDVVTGKAKTDTGSWADKPEELPLTDGLPLVGGLAKGDQTATSERLGMRPDLVGSTLLGKGGSGGSRGDVTRPAEELPVVGLPLVGQLDQLAPAGADAPAPR